MKNKQILAGLMAMLMVLAIILSIPVMTMNEQIIYAPDANAPVPKTLEISNRAKVAGEKYGLSFMFDFHPKDFDIDETGSPNTAFSMVDWDKRPSSIDDVEQIDFDTFMKSSEWNEIKTMCYHRLYEIKNIERLDFADNYIAEIKIVPVDYWENARDTEWKSIYGLLDGNHTVILELPDDYVYPDGNMATVIDQPKPVDNAATLAPKIQVDNKPMSVQHSTLTVTINGVPTELDAIVLTEAGGGAHTYYKLRDVGEKVGFDVGWTPETGITVDTRK